MYDINIKVCTIYYYILEANLSLFYSYNFYGGSSVTILCKFVENSFPNYNRFWLLINFRVLKNKQFEEKLNTTEHSVKDTSNQCSNITTESSPTAVVVALAILLGISVSALLITCVFICCKRLRRCNQLRNGTLSKIFIFYLNVITQGSRIVRFFFYGGGCHF